MVCVMVGENDGSRLVLGGSLVPTAVGCSLCVELGLRGALVGPSDGARVGNFVEIAIGVATGTLTGN